MCDCCLPHDHGGVFEHGKEKMPGTEEFSTVADVFKKLDDPSRLKIFWLLCHYRACVTNIAALLQMSKPAVSHHLRPLKASGLIVSQRAGREVYYKAADTVQAQLLHRMLEQVMEIACPSL